MVMILNPKQSKKKPKKEVEQVYKSSKSVEEANKTDSKASNSEIVIAQEADLLDRMEFVKSTKTVVALKGFLASQYGVTAKTDKLR